MTGILKTPEPPKGEHWWDGIQHQMPGNWLGAVTCQKCLRCGVLAGAAGPVKCEGRKP